MQSLHAGIWFFCSHSFVCCVMWATLPHAQPHSDVQHVLHLCTAAAVPAAEHMRDYTGLDSLLSPLFCLAVMLAVYALERCMPGRDILFFIPKSWRQPQPLYQLADEQALKETRAELAAAAAAADGDVAGGAVKDADVCGIVPVSVDGEEKLKKSAAAAAGKRPRGADDSAHAGKQALNDSQLL
jgi:hypothetical protein